VHKSRSNGHRQYAGNKKQSQLGDHDGVEDTVFAAYAAATGNVVANFKFNKKQLLAISMGVHYMLVLYPQVWRQNGELVHEGECRLGPLVLLRAAI